MVWADLSAWLRSQLTAAGTQIASAFPDFNEGPYIPEMPDELCTVTITSGIGFQMDGAADQYSFQVRIRSQQNDQSSAESQILTLDRLIFQSKFPTVLDTGSRLLLVARSGGPPSSIGPPDDSYRFDYTCNYYAIVGAA
jgi:hypothetical protein